MEAEVTVRDHKIRSMLHVIPTVPDDYSGWLAMFASAFAGAAQIRTGMHVLMTQVVTRKRSKDDVSAATISETGFIVGYDVPRGVEVHNIQDVGIAIQDVMLNLLFSTVSNFHQHQAAILNAVKLASGSFMECSADAAIGTYIAAFRKGFETNRTPVTKIVHWYAEGGSESHIVKQEEVFTPYVWLDEVPGRSEDVSTD